MTSQKDLKASIIVLCYGGLNDLTKPCIASILAHTPASDYELVIVDNASGDGTAEWIVSLASEHHNVVPVLNSTNRGYAGGNNDGMLIARGQHIVLLNNDTLVTPGWLERLLTPFKQNEGIGLVGPVTNSAGNEQRIELPGLTEANYKEVSERYTRTNSNVWFQTEKLGFFCVAIRRAVIERIGYLDENFGVGMFEDDDYCHRAKIAGFTLMVLEDCFVYHKGSMSFRKLAFAEYRSLFERNRGYFFQKHNVQWSLSELAFAYVDKFTRDLEAYTTQNEALPPEIERIKVRIENFRHLLVQIYDAEVATGSAVTTTRNTSTLSPGVRRALWHTRKRLFTNLVLHGDWTQRLEFGRRAVNYVRKRMLPAKAIPIQEVPSPLPMINGIREAHPGKKLLIFPATIDFYYMEQRPQQLARAFADAGYLVFYCTVNHKTDTVATVELAARNLYLLNEDHLYILSHVFKPEDTIFYCLWPNNIKNLPNISCSKLIYDYMDELSLLDLPADEIARDHQAIIRQADLITVSSEQLWESLPPEAIEKAILLPNAVSERFIGALKMRQPLPLTLADIPDATPIFGYYGAIAEWLDFELLHKIADAFPEARIVLIGPVMEGAELKLQELQQEKSGSVITVSPVPQLELAPYLNRFNVCMIPFVKNQITDAVSPVKLFEYFAANKPVVTTALRECMKYEVVKAASTHAEFLKYLEDCLGEPRESCRNHVFAEANTWRARAQEVIERLG